MFPSKRKCSPSELPVWLWSPWPGRRTPTWSPLFGSSIWWGYPVRRENDPDFNQGHTLMTQSSIATLYYIINRHIRTAKQAWFMEQPRWNDDLCIMQMMERLCCVLRLSCLFMIRTTWAWTPERWHQRWQLRRTWRGTMVVGGKMVGCGYLMMDG